MSQNYTHFTDKDTERKSLRNLPKIIQAVNLVFEPSVISESTVLTLRNTPSLQIFFFDIL